MFKLLKKSKKTKARLGFLKTAHGVIKTPFFMPVATRGTVKHITAEEMWKLDAQILLSNTYHLMLKPGDGLVKKAGGLHKFIGWDGPILTDSGGFQVFSLAGNKNKSGQSLVKLGADGVKFRSYIDGRKYNLTPEKALKIQIDLGVDIAVCLDECVALPANKEYIEESVKLTTRWAKKTKIYFEKIKGGLTAGGRSNRLLFAVIQGGLDKELRLKSLQNLVKLDFDGYNIGGLSVGETPREMYKVLDYLTLAMPENKSRYLMGVGYPENIIEAVKRGVDMFDCVIPTREGRHGRLFFGKKNYTAHSTQHTARNRSKFSFSKQFYRTENITKAKFARDFLAINPESKLPELRNLSKAYLHYLFKIREPLGARLASLNNLEFYLDLMKNIRYAIRNNKL